MVLPQIQSSPFYNNWWDEWYDSQYDDGYDSCGDRCHRCANNTGLGLAIVTTMITKIDVCMIGARMIDNLSCMIKITGIWKRKKTIWRNYQKKKTVNNFGKTMKVNLHNNYNHSNSTSPLIRWVELTSWWYLVGISADPWKSEKGERCVGLIFCFHSVALKYFFCRSSFNNT